MTEDKKKKLYIAIIVVCVVATGFVLYSMSGGGSTPPVDQAPLLDTTTTPRTSAGLQSTDFRTMNYGSPAVFPDNGKFNTAVFNSSKYQSLNPYDPVTVTDAELNRDDPFVKY